MISCQNRHINTLAFIIAVLSLYATIHPADVSESKSPGTLTSLIKSGLLSSDVNVKEKTYKLVKSDSELQGLSVDFLIDEMISNRGNDKDRYKRTVSMLGKIGGRKSIKAMVVAIGYSTDDSRELVLDTLVKAGKHYVDLLLDSLSYVGDPDTKIGVIKVLGRMGDKHAIKRLVELAESDICSYEVRRAVDNALRKFDSLLVRSETAKYKKPMVVRRTGKVKEVKKEKMDILRDRVVVFILDSDFNLSGHGGIAAKVIRNQCKGVEIKEIRLREGHDSNEILFKSYLRGLLFILDYAKKNARAGVVVNISLGSYKANYLEQKIIKELYREGVTIVAASGNDNSSRIQYPSGYDGVLAVASVTRASLKKTKYSNWGDHIDLCAPAYTTYVGHQSYSYVEGTSFAAPAVCGAIAELLTSNTYMTPHEAISIVKRTATPINDSYYKKGFLGRGLLNLEKAREVTVELIHEMGDKKLLMKDLWRRHRIIIILAGCACLFALIYFPYKFISNILYNKRKSRKMRYLKECEYLDSVEEALDDEDNDVRELAMDILIENMPDSAEIIERALSNPHHDVRRKAKLEWEKHLDFKLSKDPNLTYWREKGLTTKSIKYLMAEYSCTIESMVQYLNYCRRCREFLTEGQYDEAEYNCKNAINIIPRCFIAYFCLGIIYKINGSLAQAYGSFQHAYELAPMDAIKEGYISEDFIQSILCLPLRKYK